MTWSVLWLAGCPWIGETELTERRDHDGDGVDDPRDCDDDDPAVGAATLRWRDRDGDGWGDRSATPEASCPPADGWVSVGGDCDDGDAAVNGDAVERCNGVDDDCDGVVDGDDAVGTRSWYPDDDEDGVPARAEPLLSCDPIPGHASSDGGFDCDDTTDAVSPAATERCGNGIDDDCDDAIDEEGTGEFDIRLDADGDGFTPSDVVETVCGDRPGWVRADQVDPSARDCDDSDGDVFPGRPAGEDCATAADDDCDGVVERTTDAAVGPHVPDLDGDGYTGVGSERWCAPPEGWVAAAGSLGPDCDDVAAATFPGAPEVPYDTVDQDCDGADLTDADGDGFARGPDCDDGDALVHPGAEERCDGVDDDCDEVADDGAVDAYEQVVDADGDGFGQPGSLRQVACATPGWARYVPALEEDCDDSAPTTFPGATDAWYDGVDADCAGDDDFDQDGDGSPKDHTGNRELADCDDEDPEVFPRFTGEPECGDGRDDDCDGTADLYAAVGGITSHVDGDGDGFAGSLADTVQLCSSPLDGFVPAAGATVADCDDGDPTRYPGAAEVVGDEVDSDCDSLDADSDRDGDPEVTDCAPLDPTRRHGAPEWCDGTDQDCLGDDDSGLELATAWVGGVPTDVTATVDDLDLEGIEELALCGATPRTVSWVAGGGETQITHLGVGTVAGSPALRTDGRGGTVTLHSLGFVAATSEPTVALHGGRLVVQKVTAVGLAGPFVSAAAGSDVQLDGVTLGGSAVALVFDQSALRATGVEVVDATAPLLAATGASTVALDALTVDGPGGLGSVDGSDLVLEDALVAGSATSALDLSDATLTARDTHFVGNHGAFGAAISAKASTLSLEDASFESNEATGAGGAVYLFAGSSLVEVRSTYLDGLAPLGGAVACEGSSVSGVSGSFGDNAAAEGGAVRAEDCVVSYTDSRFSNDTATDAGGALALRDSVGVLTDSTVSGCSAGEGGGVWLDTLVSTAFVAAQVSFSFNDPSDVSDTTVGADYVLFTCVGDDLPQCTL